MRGSEANDPFYMDGGAVKTRTNHAGGALGGISIPSKLVKPLDTISFKLLMLFGYAALCIFVFNFTKIGRRLKFLGGNANCAKLSGIRADRYAIVAFVMAGIGVGLGAFLTLVYTPSVTATTAGGIGMNVIAYQRTYKPEYECDTMHFVSLDELFEKSDIIALSTPALGKAIIDAESIAKMKDGVVIINTSRGSNIDEAALLEALNSGKVRAAGLDVWAEEPTKNVELSQHPAVSALPHVGASTVEAQKRIGSEIVSIIENF
jgi:hypothetical protein